MSSAGELPDARDEARETHQPQRVAADLGRRALEGENPIWLFHDAAAAVADVLGADQVGIFDQAGSEEGLRLREGVGWGGLERGEALLSADELGADPVDGEPIVLGPGGQDLPSSGLLARLGVEAGVVVPVHPPGWPTGVLGVYTTEPRRFREEEVFFLEQIANAVTAALATESEEREPEAAKTERYRQALDEVMMDVSSSTEERLQRLLELGCQRLEADNGHIVRVDREKGRHEIVRSAGSDVVEPGAVHDLEETYCRETITSQRVLSVHDAITQGWETHPAYRRWGLSSYVGGQIRLENDLYGTLCFVSEEPREEPFTDTECAFVGVMARWIGQELEQRQRRRQLQEERDRLDSMVRTVQEYAIFMLDPDGHVETWNEGANRIKGYTAHEIIGRHFSRFYTEEDQEAGVPQHNLDGAAEYGTIEDEGWRLRADGSRFWANVTITAIRDDEGALRGYSKITRDMTDRRNRELELEREKERFASLIEGIDEYAIFMLDTEGKVRSWNAGARKLKGYTEAEILGRHFSTFYTEEDQEAKLPQHNVETAAEYGTVEDEGWRVRADGSRFWANVTITALRDQDGELRGFSKVTRDMTDRHRREEELRREKKRFQSLVGEVDEYAIFMLGPEGHVETWNEGAERIKGYGKPEIVGEHMSLFYTPEDREAGVPETNLERAAEQGSTEDEGWRVRQDGSRFWANVTITALHDEDGELRGFAKVTRDMTERHERERRLEESNERLEQFAYAASHDLQEPLRMVSTYLQLIETRYGEHLDEEGREFFAYAVDGAKRMRELIRSLLAFARVTTEGNPLRPIDSRAVLDDALADLHLQIEETGAEITVDELPRVEVDPDQLGQVFRNLISNALKYSGDEPPRITVGAEPEGDRRRFWVHDEGIGISEEHTEQVFRVFRRLEADERDGTGIGLAICQQIVDRHGGRMWVDSKPGEGSTFHFTMPAVGQGEVQGQDGPG